MKQNFDGYAVQFKGTNETPVLLGEPPFVFKTSTEALRLKRKLLNPDCGTVVRVRISYDWGF